VTELRKETNSPKLHKSNEMWGFMNAERSKLSIPKFEGVVQSKSTMKGREVGEIETNNSVEHKP
jgi:hypothetical protein